MSNTIYIISNTINDKVYIGQTIDFDRRKTQHLKNYKTLDYNIYLAMRKHGVENFTIEPIYSLLYRDDLNKSEEFFVSEYDSFNNGYNMSEGGDINIMYGRKHKNSSKLLMGKTGMNHSLFRGFYHTPFGILIQSTKNNLCISGSSIKKWCKNPDKIISPISVGKSSYLTENMIGKTYREIGFWFEPI